MKTTEITISNFYGGKSDDIREQSLNQFDISKHFDIYSNPKKLTPYRDFESDVIIDATSTTLSALMVENFCVGNNRLFALGAVSNSLDKIRLIERSTISGNWGLSATSTQSDAGIPIRTSFNYYKNYFYGIKGAGVANQARIWRYGNIVSGVKSLDIYYSSTTLTTIASSFTSAANGTVAKDDCLYLPYENKICKINGNIVTADRLTLPSDKNIIGTDNYEDKIAIGCSANNISENAVVYLWDLISDDVYDVLDWGEGTLKGVGTIEGLLMGISEIGGGSSLNIKPKIIIKAYDKETAKVIKEFSLIDDLGVVHSIAGIVRKKGESLYFAIIGNGELSGIYRIGRKNSNYPFAITMDRRIPGMTSIKNFYFWGDYLFVAYNNTGSSVSISRTNDTAIYANTSTWITQKYTGDNPEYPQSIEFVKLMSHPLPSGGKLRVDYRVNSTSTWTVIDSNSTQNSVYGEFTKEIGGNNFNQGNDVQFKIISSGGAQITGFRTRLQETLTAI
jgi:hypothetical protein